jgi:hypothetical protein
MRFRATVALGGRTATAIVVPDEIVAGLGPSRRPAVHATVNGYTYRSTVARMAGAFMLPISAEVREAAGVAAGDEVDVVLELDTEPRTVTVPPDLATALDREPDARRAFDSRSYSRRLRDVLAIEGARTPTTRQRRIESTLAALRVEARNRGGCA